MSNDENLVERLNYRNLNKYRQLEYEMLMRVGSLDRVVDFVEKLGCYQYLYFIKPDDMWRYFDFYYNKVKSSKPNIDKKKFNSFIMKILREHKKYAVPKLINEHRDPYDIATIIVTGEDKMPKSSTILSMCGDLDTDALCYTIALLSKYANDGHFSLDYAYNEILRNKAIDLGIKRSTFRFYAKIYIEFSNKMVVNSRVSLRHLADKDPKLVALAMNEIAYDTLLKLASRSIENKMTTPEISDEYSKLIDINNSRKKEFSNIVFSGDGDEYTPAFMRIENN